MIALHACRACGLAVFPARLLCHRCGGGAWSEIACANGLVEDCSALPARDLVLATIRCAAGPAVIAAVPAVLPPGTAVWLRPGPGHSVLADPKEVP